MKTLIRPLLSVFFLLLLLSHPDLSFSGAEAGLLLWFHVVLPTLLPFMLCSSLLVSWGGISLLLKPLTPIRLLFRLSPEGSYCLLSGLLCGYPMGAKTTADFLREKRISSAEGKRLLAICGCPSPMFVAGYLAPRMEQALSGSVFLLLPIALYLPIFLIGSLSGWAAPVKRSSANLFSDSVPAKKAGGPDKAAPVFLPFDELLMNSLEIMVKIGGFMMLYSILSAFLEAAPQHTLSPFSCALLLNATEMTTGINYAAAHLSGASAAGCMLFGAAFGGLSGISQTQTVIKNAGLSIRHYIGWKLIHASLSCVILILLSSLQQLPHPAVLPL